MKLAREVEKRLERLVDGLSAAVFRGRMHPVDVANRLVREADLSAADGTLGPQIPNHWTVRMGPADLDATSMHDLGTELTHALETTAAERGWRTDGRVVVDVVPDATVRSGGLAVGSTVDPGAGEPWAQLLDPDRGAHHALADNRVLVGRAEHADIRIEHAKISRRHAVIFREGGKAWVQDLGSANGTSINDGGLGEDPAPLRPGDVVSFGPIAFTFRLRG